MRATLHLLTILLFFSSASCTQSDDLNTICDHVLTENINQYNESRIWTIDLKAAFNQLDSLEDIALANDCQQAWVDIKVNEINALSYNDLTVDMYEAIINLEKHIQNNAIPPSINNFLLLYFQGRYHKIMGNLPTASEKFKLAQDTLSYLYEAKLTNEETYNRYYPSVQAQLGITYMTLGRLDEATTLYKDALLLNPPLGKQALYHKHLGKVYRLSEQYSLAEEYYNQSLSLYEKKMEQDASYRKKGKNGIISLFNDHAQMYLDRSSKESNPGLLTQAEKLLEKAATFTIKTDDPILIYTYHTIGKLAFQQRDFKKAIQYFNKAIAVSPSDWNKAQNHIQLALIYNQMQEPSKALKVIDKAIGLLEGIVPTEQAIADIHYLEALKIKGKILHKQGQLKAAWRVFNQGLQALNNTLVFYEIAKDKENLLAKSYDFFEAAIAVGYQLAKTSNDDHYIYQALAFSEKSKAILLKDVYSQSFVQQVQLPSRVIHQHKDFKSKLVQLQRKIQKGNSKKEVEQQNIQDFLALQAAFQNFRKSTLSQYPKYQQLVDDYALFDLKSIQDQLPIQHTTVEYFIGNQQSFVFLVYADQSPRIIELATNQTQLNKQVDAYFNCLQAAEDSECLQSLPQQSHDIYLSIFAPITEQLHDRITIIPDGALCYVPFSTLVTTQQSPLEEGQRYDYSQLPYLLHDYTINYNYSIQLSLNGEHPSKISNRANFMGFAPDYSHPFSPLAGSQHTVESISQHFDNNKLLFLNKKAKKSNFIKNIEQADIIHLHLHGVLDANDSYLAFSDTEKDSRLHISEIFGLRIPATIVTLPACHAGYGKNLRGQGLMSLARSFYYAGTSNIYPSLWKGNNNAMQQITLQFYDNLHRGLDKDKAMQQAKISYLQENRYQLAAYPFYWGGYLPIGKFLTDSN